MPFGCAPPSIVSARLPQRRPAHQYAQSKAISAGMLAISATTRSAWPVRASAPIVTIEVVEPRMSSSSSGWLPTSDGTSGSRISAYRPLAVIPAMMIRSARSGRPSHGRLWARSVM